MSQDDLARKITENPPDSVIFHQQTIQKIENGNRGISLTDAVLIVVALDVDLNTMLLGPEGPDMTLDERVKDDLRRDMHVSHLAVKAMESTLKKLERVFDIAPVEEQHDAAKKGSGTDPAPSKSHRHSIFDEAETAEAERFAKERHDSLHSQIDEHLAEQASADHGVDK